MYAAAYPLHDVSNLNTRFISASFDSPNPSGPHPPGSCNYPVVTASCLALAVNVNCTQAFPVPRVGTKNLHTGPSFLAEQSHQNGGTGGRCSALTSSEPHSQRVHRISSLAQAPLPLAGPGLWQNDQGSVRVYFCRASGQLPELKLQIPLVSL